MKNIELRTQEDLETLTAEVISSADLSTIVKDLSKYVKNTIALEKLLFFMKEEVPNINSIDILSDERVEYIVRRIALFIEVDMSLLDDDIDKKFTRIIAENIIRTSTWDILNPIWISNPTKAARVIQNINDAINKVSIVQSIKKEELIQIIGINEIEKSFEIDALETTKAEQNVKNYFFCMGKYVHKLEKLGIKLKDEYQYIASKDEFVKTMHNLEGKQCVLRCKSDDKLKELIGVIVVLKDWQIIRVKGNNGFWIHLKEVLRDNCKNRIDRDLNRFASKIRSKKLLISNLEKILGESGFENEGQSK